MGQRLKFAVLLVILFLSCKPEEVIREGWPVPDFSLRDLEGNSFSLSDSKGKVVLIEFWATWCEACREAVPDLMEIYKKNRNKEFEMIAVSVDEGPDAKDRVKEFVREYNISYRVALSGTALSKRFGVYTIPTLFIIDRSGILVKRYPGYFSDMSAKIDKEIKGLL